MFFFSCSVNAATEFILSASLQVHTVNVERFKYNRGILPTPFWKFFFKFFGFWFLLKLVMRSVTSLKVIFNFFFFCFSTWTRRWTGGNFSEREEGAGVIRFVSCPSQTVRIEWPAARHTINTLSAIFRTTLIQLVIMSLIKQPLLRLPQRCRVQFLWENSLNHSRVSWESCDLTFSTLWENEAEQV